MSGRILSAVRALPGVSAAGLGTTLPFATGSSNSIILPEGTELKSADAVVSPTQITVSDGYFEALRIPLLRGRYFDTRDTPTTQPVVILDERLARRFWPRQEPIGRRLYKPSNPRNLLATGPDTRYLTVVGVVGEVPTSSLTPDSPPVGAYYFPYTQLPARSVAFAIQSDQNPQLLIGSVRSTVTAIDGELALYDVATMEQRLDRSLVRRRVPMLVAGSFALISLLLATIGVHAILAYQVGERRREIGIRLALGSTRQDVFRLILRDGLRIVGVGLAVGLLGALAISRLVANLLHGVRPLELSVITAAVIVVFVAALVAMAIPARRAAAVDPAVTLGH